MHRLGGPLLSVDNLHVYHGAIHALQGIDFVIERGEIVTLIGANGAGKSSTLRCLSGLLPAAEGSRIIFDGRDITNAPAHEIVAMGICQSPEGRRIFAEMSVEENLFMGAYSHRTVDAERLEYVYSLFPLLAERRAQRGGTLSGGEQQMLAIGRALMTRPRLLLLDEPSLGLAPLLVREIFGIIATLNQRDDVTILLVEQNANQALATAHRGYVMETGRITLSDQSAALLANDMVRQAYLGE
ncbi:MAG: ABC transporter ATP-binding protein [Armatimonadetes bacterium]|nr:ABC transporter ATP-binding protein [Armatimonadota bacterium]